MIMEDFIGSSFNYFLQNRTYYTCAQPDHAKMSSLIWRMQGDGTAISLAVIDAISIRCWTVFLPVYATLHLHTSGNKHPWTSLKEYWWCEVIKVAKIESKSLRTRSVGAGDRIYTLSPFFTGHSLASDLMTCCGPLPLESTCICSSTRRCGPAV